MSSSWEREGERELCSEAVCQRLKRDCGEISCRAMTEEEGACDMGSCKGKERWSSCVDDEIDETFSEMDDSYSPDLGDEWRTRHVDDPETAEEKVFKKKRKNIRKGRRKDML